MGREDPESVVLSSEGLDGGSLAHVPDANSLVFGVGDDELVLGVEEGARDVVKVAAASVDFPGLGVAHAPEFDLTVVAGRDNQRQRGMECCPIDTAVVAFENVFDDGVGVAKEIRLSIRSLYLVLVFVGRVQQRVEKRQKFMSSPQKS